LLPTPPAGLSVLSSRIAPAQMRLKLSLPISATAGMSTISKPNRRTPLTTVFTATGQSVAATRSVPAGMTRPRIRRATPNFRRVSALIFDPPLLLCGGVTMPLADNKNQPMGDDREVERSKSGRAVLQQDQAVSACSNPL